MRGVLDDCFDIAGRGVVVALIQCDGDLKAGDWIVVASKRWRVAGVEMPNYFGRTPPQGTAHKTGALLSGASTAELLPLLGQPFHTERPDLEKSEP